MCQLYKKKYFMIDLDLLRSSLMKNEKQKSCHNPLIGLWVMKTLFIGNLKYILRISYIWFNHFLHIYVCCRACRDCERSENLGVLYEVNLTSQCSHLEVLLISKFWSERGDFNWCRFCQGFCLWTFTRFLPGPAKKESNVQIQNIS